MRRFPLKYQHNRLSHVAKEYRNLVHPGREIRDNVKFSGSGCQARQSSRPDIGIREVADGTQSLAIDTFGRAPVIFI